MTENQRISGSRGSKLLAITVTHSSLGAYCVIAQEDAVFTVFKVNAVDSLTAYGLNASATLKAGSLITVPEQDAITDITLSSGSVIIYNY